MSSCQEWRFQDRRHHQHHCHQLRSVNGIDAVGAVALNVEVAATDGHMRLLGSFESGDCTHVAAVVVAAESERPC